jgi:hypothetical protein
MFSYEICDPVIHTSNIPPVVHAKTNTTPVDPFDAQNNVELPMVIGQNSNSVPVVVRQNNNSLPVVVEPIEAQNIIQLPIVVEPIEAQNNIDLPIVVEPVEAKSIADLPIEAKSNTDLSIGVEHNSVVPNEANNENQSFIYVLPCV